jgi:hypothetical protein
VIDEVDTRIRTLQHKIVPARLFLFGVHQDSPLNRIRLAQIQDIYRKSLVGHNDAVRRQHLLSIPGALHGTQHGFEIGAYLPRP